MRRALLGWALCVRIVILLLQLVGCWSFIKSSAKIGKAAWSPRPGRASRWSSLTGRGAWRVLESCLDGAEAGSADGLDGPGGLLDGVVHPDKAPFFSKEMDLGRAAEMVSCRGLLYEAAERDAQERNEMLKGYLKRIKDEAYRFISTNEIVNRQDLVDELDSIAGEAGNFVCLLGGKSTGKSLLLKDLAKRKPGKVFVIDLRVHGTILAGLVRVLPLGVSPTTWASIVADIAGWAKSPGKPLPEVVKRFTTDMAVKAPSLEGVADGFGLVQTASQTLKEVLDEWGARGRRGEPLPIVVDTFMEKKGEPVTIVVDEANIAFHVEPETEPGVIQETRAALQYFTSFTKQRQQGNVILVSSEHAFPFGLTRKEIGFNLDNFSGFLYAGEVPPGEMLELLEKRWGIGKHLARALVAHYGGHVWETYLALRMLRGPASQARRVGLDPLKSSGVRKCLSWQPQPPADDQRARVREVLRELAIRGFAPISDEEEKVAEVISLHNVGGVVKGDSLAAGVPPGAWGDSEYGLVPATQSMRLAIARQLVLEESRM